MKSKIKYLFIGLAILANVYQATTQVTNLGIAPKAGGQSVLYWPASGATNYVLQTTANLSPPNWGTASNTVAVNAVTADAILAAI